MTLQRRKRERKTDYKAREAMLRSGKPRVVFRKTNKRIIGQFVKSEEAQDKVLAGVDSSNLIEYGWSKDMKGSLKSLPASYLTGLILGKKVKDLDEKEAVFDLGLLRSIAKSRIYAFLKGVIDGGVKIKANEKMFPDEKMIKGKVKNFDEIKQKIEKKFK